ncbi:3-hydroxyacyl-CoA dehydrogenase [Cupriavidus lacunae]|uniref:3-hydroxyacyl-CoA dehydrogenase n=1 Tax=Cupriavidus lacunae TaxID=2666307 RepID=A0A370NRY9_9BURK|nr:hypothetical protein DN412_21320 [Cupriavidus lacunae]
MQKAPTPDEIAAPARERALAHIARAEARAVSIPSGPGVKPRSLQCVGVVGGGTMGVGICVCLLTSGLPVTVVERDSAALQRALGRARHLLEGMYARERLDAVGLAKALENLHGAEDYHALSDCDLVIEAIFEDMAAKLEVFEALDRVCRPGCILATNTSFLDVNALAARVSRPQDVIGLHFFSPAHVMKLLEVVVPDQVAEDVVATGMWLAGRLGKIPVRAGVCDGFIGNRILANYKLAGEYLVEDGASPYQVDRAMRSYGFAMGMYEVSDLAGGDIGWATRRRRAPLRNPRQRYVQFADRLCERGWFGQKSGRGFYLYRADTRQGEMDPEVLAIIDAERTRAGIVPRTFDDSEIQRRIRAAIVNEGCKVLDEGIAARPLDIDIVFANGYGFPRWRGGPMFDADHIGLPQILADLEDLSAEDEYFWEPSPLLRSLVATGTSIADLNE